jgi:PAS domain S-box-containing protein
VAAISEGVPSKEELFELVVDSSTDFAIFTTGPDGAVTSWNVGAERLFGYSAPEMLMSSVDRLFTPEDQAEGAPEKERAAARVDGRATDERWHQRKDGSRFWASGLMMPLRGGNGFVKITRDRTEQHRAGERLRENEQRFRLLATSVPQLVFLTRPDGSRTWPSPQWIEFTGLNAAKSLGFGWLDAIHPDDRDATRNAWRGAQEKGEYYIEHRVRRREDGEYLWHQTRAKPLEGADSSSSDWVGTMTDIDGIRGLQSRQQVLMAELQHRTRNLLSVVQAIASQTLRSSSSLESFGSQFASRLRALSRVQGLLARVEDQRIDLHGLVMAELAAHVDSDDTGRVTTAGPAVALPPSAAQALGLALHELATNAVKYGALAQPGGRLDVTWRLKEEKVPPEIALEWRESGVSIHQPPKRRGYGSELIERALPYQLNAKTRLEFGSDGVRCDILVPVPAEVAHG